MSGTGTVDDVFGANVPDTDVPAQKVIVNRPDQPQVAFFIPEGVDPPLAGEVITWGARHCEYRGRRVAKLSWEEAP